MYNLLNFSFYNFIYFFVFYSFAGWCLEVLYYFKNERRFVNRGFLYGPFCPIYGFGVLFLITFLDSYKNNIFSLFILACFFTTVLEYFTGLFLEKAFKTKWWDYTDDPFNIHGRVCLLYSLFWGLGEIFIIRVIHPIVVNLLDTIPRSLGETFIVLIAFYFVIDFSLTIISLMQFNKQFFAFQFVQSNLTLDKPILLFHFTKEKAIIKIKYLGSFFNKFKFNRPNLNLIQNISYKYKPLNKILETLKDKMKKD